MPTLFNKDFKVRHLLLGSLAVVAYFAGLLFLAAVGIAALS